ncbi:exopolysaccharide biosynthesis polyprenyl glycosylphosphotransferase [Actinomadura roseirufa]|uniref:exopolysaccharide biosynthesis polyprenyl glycosylphosphotransferase n=1 Tax=Actinomadura roseirufa TaxID=2094049 RepID=UPI001F5FE7A3|nr:exopolysaccharide biosynthesis polyprenyl glycosylphosphotransferase [Actinomadura roseirufa]
MRAQGLSASIESEAPLPDLTPSSGETAAVLPRVPSLPRRRGGAARPRLLASLYPACLAVADAWAMATAVTVALTAAHEPRPAGALPAVAAVTVVGLNAAGGLYRVRRSPSLLADLRPVLVRAALAGTPVAVLAGTADLGAVAAPVPPWSPLLWIIVLACALSLGARAFAHAAVRAYRCRRSRSRPTLVIGTGPTTEHVADLLRARGEFGLAPVGQVTAGGGMTNGSAKGTAGGASNGAANGVPGNGVPVNGVMANGAAANGVPVNGVAAGAVTAAPGGTGGMAPVSVPVSAPVLPVLGDTADLPALVEEHGVDTLMVVAEDVDPGRLDAVLRMSFGLACETLLVQPPSDVVPVAAARREYLAGLPCARVDWPLRRPGARYAKRLLDLAVACALLVVAAPLLAACALAARLETGPGVLFRQRRVGLGGEVFVLLKFRTLKPADEREADTRWTVEGDHRMGPVGRFLRRTSLDELPQLWNVVRGDMSLVGPRPERPHFVEQFSRTCPGYMLRHRMPVGMTGWAQVHGFRGDTSIELRARLDNHYIDHWSFAVDLRILALTVRAMLCRDAG